MKLPYKYILVRFFNRQDKTEARKYCYFVPQQMPVKEGDVALVYVNNVPALAEITDVSGIPESSRKAASRVIAGVLGKEQLDLWKVEQERLREYMDIRAKLQEAKDQHDELAVFTMLAKDNDQVAALLSRLDVLAGGNGNALLQSNSTNNQDKGEE